MNRNLVSLLLSLTLPGAATASEFSIGSINHLGLAVTDLPASQEFFIETLGFELVEEDGDYALDVRRDYDHAVASDRPRQRGPFLSQE